MAAHAVKKVAKGAAKSRAGKKAATYAGKKASESSMGQRFMQQAREIYTGPNRGKAIAATVAVGALALYAIGPGRVLRYAPIAYAGVRTALGRG